MKETLITTKTTEAKPLNINLNFRTFGIVGLILIIFYAFLGRGLYFKPELLTAVMLIAGILALAVVDVAVRGETPWFRQPLDYLVVGLAVCYVVTLFWAESKPLAVLGALKYTTYAAIFLATVQIIGTWRSYRILVEFIFGGSVIVAMIGILAMAGALQYPGASDGKAILSTLQYQNALAILMAVGSLLGFGLWALAQKEPLKEMGYMVGLQLMNIALLGTQSRAVWIMYPVLLLLWVVGLPKEVRYRLLLGTCYALVTAIITSRAFFSQVELGNQSTALSILTGALLLSMAGWIGIHRLNRWMNRRSMGPAVRKFWKGLGVAYLIAVLVIYGVYTIKTLPAGWDAIVPAEVTKQLGTVTATDHSFTARFVFYQDALTMAQDRLWQGTGAGGWEVLYTKYRSLPYTSTEVHNHYLQVLVETGIVGFVIYLGIWGTTFYYLYRLYRKGRKEAHWPVVWAVAVSVIAIALHSFIDFDLSIPTLALVTWLLLALTRCGYHLVRKEPAAGLPGQSRWLVLIAGIAVAAVIFLPGYNLFAAGQLGAEGAVAMEKGELALAEQKFQAAAVKDRTNGSYLADLAKINLVYYLQEGNKEKLKEGITLAKAAVQKDPYNYRLKGNLITTYMLADMMPEAAEEGERFIRENPMSLQAYEVVAMAGVEGAIFYSQQGQLGKSLVFLSKVVTIPERLEALKDQVQRESGRAYTYESFLKLTPRLKLAVGQAYVLLGQWEKGQTFLEAALKDEQVQRETAPWLAVAYQRVGDATKLEKLEQKYAGQDPNYAALKQQVTKILDR